jgi:WD40 repeat protein
MKSNFFYQVGGALPTQAPCYIERDSDRALYDALKQGEYCYVFDARQVGKSSLLVQVRSRLESEGLSCVWLDLSAIGSENTTPEQWYLGIASELWLRFDLIEAINLVSWWQQQGELSPVQKLRGFFEKVLLPTSSEQSLLILIDEVDSILGLNFPTTDFFALIRFFYNQRAINPDFQRLTFALFGVAVPNDLINDPKRTPFNIGKSIPLTGFQWQEAQPLIPGFQDWKNPQNILKAVLFQTGGQPFLTQKLCKLLTEIDSATVTPGQEAQWVENVARSRIIERWESQDEPEHLRTIADRLLRNSERVGRILGIYQKLLAGETIPTDNSREQVDLLLSGLLVRANGTLKVRNPIYRAVFNKDWVAQQLARLRPYAENLQAWKNSHYQDTSRLLRGQALLDAQNWAQGKSLSDLDYQFLSASQAVDRQELQLKLEAERAQATATALAQQKKVNRWQRFAIGGISVALVFVAALGAIAFSQYRRATLSNIRSLVSASEGLFASERRLDALLAALQAKQEAQKIAISPELANNLDRAFQTTVFGVDELNRLLGHKGEVLDVVFCPQDRCIATASNDGTVKLWKPNGALITTLEMASTAFSLDISADGRHLVAVDLVGNLKLWKIEDLQAVAEKWTIAAHQGTIWDVSWSPDDSMIATAGGEGTVKFFDRSGTLVNTFDDPSAEVWSVAFSPEGKLIAASDRNGNIYLWERSGKLLRHFPGNPGGVWDLQFHPLSPKLASAGADGKITFWDFDGKKIREITAHEGEVWGIDFTADGKKLASVSLDSTVKIWRQDGSLLQKFLGHRSGGRSVAWSKDESAIASVSSDQTIRLWRSQSSLLTRNYEHPVTVWDIHFSPNGKWVTTTSDLPRLWKREKMALVQPLPLGKTYAGSARFTPDGQYILTGGANNEIQVWQWDGIPVKTITPLRASAGSQVIIHPDGKEILFGREDGAIERWYFDGTFRDVLPGQQSRVWTIVYSPDGTFFASASEDGSVWVRNRAGEVQHIWEKHEAPVWGVAISPDSQTIASSSQDGTVQLWTPEGRLLNTLRGEHNQQFSFVDFSPDGSAIAAGGMDGTITLWSSQGNHLATLYSHTQSIMEVRFSPDSSLLASAGDDRTLVISNLEKIINLDHLEFACSWVEDYLQTSGEVKEEDFPVCQQY